MHIHDITMPVHPGMLVWPKDPAPIFETIQTIERDGNQTTLLHVTTHTGTHIDAPKHFIQDAGSVDEIDPSVLVGPCEVIQIPDEANIISAALLEKHGLREKAHGAPRILFKTKNSRLQLLQKETFFDDFTALTPDAADLLVAAGVKFVGMDYLSCENPKYSGTWEVHRRLLSAKTAIVEGCDLSKVPPGRYDLIVLPLRLAGLDGSPVRALLITP